MARRVQKPDAPALMVPHLALPVNSQCAVHPTQYAVFHLHQGPQPPPVTFGSAWVSGANDRPLAPPDAQ